MKNPLPKEISETRTSEYPIHPLILSRWSPRSMTGEPITDEELMPLLEAARWAPSSYNGQPWRFIYAKRNTAHWNHFLSLLTETNQKWASKAGALILVISHKIFEHNQKPSISHSFDAGSAWMCLALQGNASDIAVHAMQGFDYEKAREICSVPLEYQVEVMIAVGKRGEKENLPSEMQEKETPSKRKPLKDIAMEGNFK